MHTHGSINKYADEETPSDITYPDNYAPRTLVKQVHTIRQQYPYLRSYYSYSPPQVPPHAEGWFAIPRWECIGKTYLDAVNRVLSILEPSESILQDALHVEKDGLFVLKSIHDKQVVLKRLLDIEQRLYQKDYIVVAAQMGRRHRGRSSRRVLEVCRNTPIQQPYEVPLGLFEMACILLAHPKLLALGARARILCPGDEYVFRGAAGVVSKVPVLFRKTNGVLALSAVDDDSFTDDFMSPTAFFQDSATRK